MSSGQIYLLLNDELNAQNLIGDKKERREDSLVEMGVCKLKTKALNT